MWITHPYIDRLTNWVVNSFRRNQQQDFCQLIISKKLMSDTSTFISMRCVIFIQTKKESRSYEQLSLSITISNLLEYPSYAERCTVCRTRYYDTGSGSRCMYDLTSANVYTYMTRVTYYVTGLCVLNTAYIITDSSVSG